MTTKNGKNNIDSIKKKDSNQTKEKVEMNIKKKLIAAF